MNIEEIKQNVIKAIECDKETMPDYYYDMDMGNHIKTLAADIEYLLSIIEQLNDGIDEALKHSKNAPYDSIFENKDRLLEVRSILQAIRKGD